MGRSTWFRLIPVVLVWSLVACSRGGGPTSGETGPGDSNGGGGGGAEAPTYGKSGTVTLNGAGLQGVKIALSGATSGNTTTDDDGNYAFTELANGSYTVAPSLAGYSLSPTSQAIKIDGGNVTGINFTATATTDAVFSISGTVTLNGSAFQGVTMFLGGTSAGSAVTGAAGSYAFSDLPNSFYTVIPSRAGYSFDPPSQTVRINGASATSFNFTATVSSGGGGSNQPLVTLIMHGIGQGSGTTTLSPKAEIEYCTTQCGGLTEVAYRGGTVVTIRATSDTDSVFGGWWDGCMIVVDTTCIIIMGFDQNSPANVKPIFNLLVPELELSVSKAGIYYNGGTVTSDPPGIACGTICVGTSRYLTSGTVVTLTASPEPGYTFVGWGKACTGTSISCTVTMDASKSVTATFNTPGGPPIGAATLTVDTYAVDANRGSITSSPAGINCTAGAKCSAFFSIGTKVTLTAHPFSGYTFSGWSGACTGTSLSCAVTMGENKSVTADFDKTSSSYRDTTMSDVCRLVDCSGNTIIDL